MRISFSSLSAHTVPRRPGPSPILRPPLHPLHRIIFRPLLRHQSPWKVSLGKCPPHFPPAPSGLRVSPRECSEVPFLTSAILSSHSAETAYSPVSSPSDELLEKRGSVLHAATAPACSTAPDTESMPSINIYWTNEDKERRIN